MLVHTKINYGLLFVISIAPFMDFVDGHAYLAVPISRNLLNNGGSYGPGDIWSLHAGGKSYERNLGQHGLCGDYLPRNEFEAPNAFGPKFPTVASYIEGHMIDIEVQMVNHHWGWFEFRICQPSDGGKSTSIPSSQSCLNQHVLKFDLNYTSTLYKGQMMDGSGLQSPADYTGDVNFYK